MNVNLLTFDEMVNKLCPLRHPDDVAAQCRGPLCYGFTPTQTDEYLAEFCVERHYLGGEYMYDTEDPQTDCREGTYSWHNAHGWKFVPYVKNKRHAHYVEPLTEALKRRTYFCSAMPGAASMGGE